MGGSVVDGEGGVGVVDVVRKAVAGPGTNFVPYRLPGVLRLFCAIDREGVLREDQALQTLASGNEMFADDVLDEFVQHCPILGSLIPVALFLFIIALGLLHFSC